MVYGVTPFAHIRNMVQKMYCIIDKSVEISFPLCNGQPLANKALLATMKVSRRFHSKTRYEIRSFRKIEDFSSAP